jgi:hypothetical protein
VCAWFSFAGVGAEILRFAQDDKNDVELREVDRGKNDVAMQGKDL